MVNYVELRVHGVSGPPPEDVLGSPAGAAGGRRSGRAVRATGECRRQRGPVRRWTPCRGVSLGSADLWVVAYAAGMAVALAVFAAIVLLIVRRVMLGRFEVKVRASSAVPDAQVRA